MTSQSPPAGERTCRKCSVTKPKELFATTQRNVKTNGGYQNLCLDCRNLEQRASWLKNRDKRLAATKEYFAAKRETVYAQRRAYRASVPKERATGRTMARNAIAAGKIPETPCVVCGSRENLEFHHTNGYDRPNWLVGVFLCRDHHREGHRNKRLNDLKQKIEREKEYYGK